MNALPPDLSPLVSKSFRETVLKLIPSLSFLSALYGVLFEKDEEAAFSNYRQVSRTKLFPCCVSLSPSRAIRLLHFVLLFLSLSADWSCLSCMQYLV